MLARFPSVDDSEVGIPVRSHIRSSTRPSSPKPPSPPFTEGVQVWAAQASVILKELE